MYKSFPTEVHPTKFLYSDFPVSEAAFERSLSLKSFKGQYSHPDNEPENLKYFQVETYSTLVILR